jgi:hypothetical protein
MNIRTNANKTDYVHTFRFSLWGRKVENLPDEIYENRNAFMVQYNPSYVSTLLDLHRFEINKLLLFNRGSVERYKNKTHHILLVSIPNDSPEYTTESFTENKWIKVLPVIDETHMTYMKLIEITKTAREKNRVNKSVKVFCES